MNENMLKPIIIGFFASFMMFVVMAPLIMFNIAPFNLPPHAAFLVAFGWNATPFPLVLHLVYGSILSVIYVNLFKGKERILTGLLYSLALWLLLMIVYSPIIGWGPFGFGQAGLLPPDDPLYLGSPYSYMFITLLLNLIYGALIGYLNPLWESFDTL
jgi:uncharacterized membrane protein YagU involved in acid resistance